MKLNTLKGKSATIFTLDNKVVGGEVIEIDTQAIYIKENNEKTRIIMMCAIASISVNSADAVPVLTPDEIAVVHVRTNPPKHPGF